MTKHYAKQYAEIIRKALENHQQQRLMDGTLHVYYTTAQHLEMARLKKMTVLQIPSSTL